MAHQVRKRMTRQLSAVYAALQAASSHPSADEIHQQVKKILPQISLGTVYRNLQRLVEEGKVNLLFLGERTARYDSMLMEHDHFVCLQCGAVLDVLLDRDRRVNLTPLLEQGFTVATQSLSVHGLCRACARKSSKNAHAKTQESHQPANAERGAARFREGRGR
jgi:Fe2+ or Zn2+ uptake regulation protein